MSLVSLCCKKHLGKGLDSGPSPQASLVSVPHSLTLPASPPIDGVRTFHSLLNSGLSQRLAWLLWLYSTYVNNALDPVPRFKRPVWLQLHRAGYNGF